MGWFAQIHIDEDHLVECSLWKLVQFPEGLFLIEKKRSHWIEETNFYKMACRRKGHDHFEVPSDEFGVWITLNNA